MPDDDDAQPGSPAPPTGTPSGGGPPGGLPPGAPPGAGPPPGVAAGIGAGTGGGPRPGVLPPQGAGVPMPLRAAGNFARGMTIMRAVVAAMRHAIPDLADTKEGAEAAKFLHQMSGVFGAREAGGKEDQVDPIMRVQQAIAARRASAGGPPPGGPPGGGMPMGPGALPPPVGAAPPMPPRGPVPFGGPTA